MNKEFEFQTQEAKHGFTPEQRSIYWFGVIDALTQREAFEKQVTSLYESEYGIPCIDMLRQWLNERPSGPVSTKDLEHWLKPLIEETCNACEK